MANTCDICRFLFVTTGECRRGPPTVIVLGTEPRAYWPMVADSDWCGEFQPASGGAITLTSITPNTLPAGSTPASVDVVGAGFDDTCVVYADNLTRTTFYISPTQLQYTDRPDLATSGESRQITVQNGLGDVSNALPFNFT